MCGRASEINKTGGHGLLDSPPAIPVFACWTAHLQSPSSQACAEHGLLRNRHVMTTRTPPAHVERHRSGVAAAVIGGAGDHLPVVARKGVGARQPMVAAGARPPLEYGPAMHVKRALQPPS